jgi:PAS domain S-box-containing protein
MEVNAARRPQTVNGPAGRPRARRARRAPGAPGAPGARRLHEAAWPDVLANLQTAYSELTHTKFELERRAAEIGEARDLFQRVIESMSEALFLLDRAGRVVQANPAAAALLGCDEADLAGKPLVEVCGTDQMPTTPWQLLQRAPAGSLANLELEIRTPAGRAVPVGVSCALVRDRWGQITGVLVVARDETERKRAEAAITRLNADLQRHADELAAANRELEAFSYSVSHDLRAPLRVMDGFSRILLKEHAAALPPPAQHYLRRVCENAQQMGRLIDDLLEFSRLSRQPLQRRRVAPATIVREALADLEGERAGRRCEIAIGALPECWADAALLKRAFVNLLANALKYTRQREAAVVEIGARVDEGAEPVYFVRDNGVGFDPRYAHKLFGVFQRLHRAEDYEGTGVGLAIVQRVVHRHGGRVWAEAAVDRGATFSFTLGVRERGNAGGGK